jgi:hypothetical protein
VLVNALLGSADDWMPAAEALRNGSNEEDGSSQSVFGGSKHTIQAEPSNAGSEAPMSPGRMRESRPQMLSVTSAYGHQGENHCRGSQVTGHRASSLGSTPVLATEILIARVLHCTAQGAPVATHLMKLAWQDWRGRLAAQEVEPMVVVHWVAAPAPCCHLGVLTRGWVSEDNCVTYPL